MKKVLVLLALVWAVGLSAADLAATAKKCAACHGVNGEKKALNKSKIIKDLSKEEFIAAMNGYKDGTYGGPTKAVMKPQVATLNDEDFKALADFYIK